MDIEFLKGRKINDITTEETKIVQMSDGIAGLKLSDQLGIQKYENLDVISDRDNEIIVCFKDNKAVAIFHIYEPRYISLYGKIGLVMAAGNGNVHLYWFDNDEYISDWY